LQLNYYWNGKEKCQYFIVIYKIELFFYELKSLKLFFLTAYNYNNQNIFYSNKKAHKFKGILVLKLFEISNIW